MQRSKAGLQGSSLARRAMHACGHGRLLQEARKLPSLAGLAQAIATETQAFLGIAMRTTSEAQLDQGSKQTNLKAAKKLRAEPLGG